MVHIVYLMQPYFVNDLDVSKQSKITPNPFP